MLSAQRCKVLSQTHITMTSQQCTGMPHRGLEGPGLDAPTACDASHDQFTGRSALSKTNPGSKFGPGSTCQTNNDTLAKLVQGHSLRRTYAPTAFSMRAPQQAARSQATSQQVNRKSQIEAIYRFLRGGDGGRVRCETTAREGEREGGRKEGRKGGRGKMWRIFRRW
jgi:hypothetical protein